MSALKNKDQGIARLKKRRDFLYVASGRRHWAGRGLVLQARRQKDDIAGEMRVGFTVTKKTGNAVRRNRIRRRLKALAQEILPHHAKPGFDYVLIGRYAGHDRAFDGLRRDLEMALGKTGCLNKGKDA